MQEIPDTRKLFCSQLAQEAGDPVTGTATDVTTWLLLEYRQPWHTRATEDNELPAAVQSHLDAALATIPGSRLLFIKQQEESEDGLRFFVARTDEVAPQLYQFELADYDALTGLDLPAVAAGEGAFDERIIDKPLFLVCTNGKRDKCCAKFGLPMFKAIAAAAPEETWQSTHMGGHRYAPNVMFLPHSVNYGLMAATEGPAAVAAHQRGELYDLDRYRGRTYYDAHVNAADTFARQELDLMRLDGLRLAEDEALEENVWRVRFYLAESEQTLSLTVAGELTAEPRLIGCSTPSMAPVERFRLLDRPSAG
jgi:hypothetical protein